MEKQTDKPKTCETCAFGDPDRDDMVWCEEEEQLKDPDDVCCHHVRK